MEIDRKWKRVIKDINAITPEYMKHRIEEETQQYKQEIERLNNIIKDLEKYIRSNEWGIDYEHSNCRTHLLEILDKESK